MIRYAPSLLAATGKLTGGESRKVKSALKKLADTPSDKLILEVDMAIPRGLAEKHRVEVIAKLIKQLKAGPLKHCNNNDEAYLEGAIAFLVTDEGKAWIRSWFLPIVAETASTAANLPAALASNEPVTIENLGLALGGTPGSRVAAPGNHLNGSPISGAILLSNPMPTLRGGTSPAIVSIQNSSAPTSVRSPSPAAALPSPVAREAGNGIALPGPSMSQHQRAHSDPGQLAVCPRCHNVHCASLGGPVSASPTAGGMELRRVGRNEERWVVRTVRHVTNPLNVIAWSLVVVLLFQLNDGYPKH